jgi:hypothetical protein
MAGTVAPEVRTLGGVTAVTRGSSEMAAGEGKEAAPRTAAMAGKEEPRRATAAAAAKEDQLEAAAVGEATRKESETGAMVETVSQETVPADGGAKEDRVVETAGPVAMGSEAVTAVGEGALRAAMGTAVEEEREVRAAATVVTAATASEPAMGETAGRAATSAVRGTAGAVGTAVLSAEGRAMAAAEASSGETAATAGTRPAVMRREGPEAPHLEKETGATAVAAQVPGRVVQAATRG